MQQILQRWLARDPDLVTKEELLALIEKGHREEISQRFAQRLVFGTAGLRGVVGAGPARMNRLVVRETSAGLANYILQSLENAPQRGIMLAYDGRSDSYQFAKDTACVFAACGIRVYLTDGVAPTPVGAFGVKHLGCAAGVVITASHNPREYNGYKVYWENGAQIIPPHDKNIAAAIDKAATMDIPWMEFESAVAAGKIQLLGTKFYQAYADAILNSPLFAKSCQPQLVSIAYTALHGVGADLAESLLDAAGFDKVYSVGCQREPDGTFPTVDFPNPEEPGAMDEVIALAKQQCATLACANDPDADRLAVACRTQSGDYEMLTGDQIGLLLGNYALSKANAYTPIICSSIVSSTMLERVCIEAGAAFRQTLTGFKWLTNVAMASEDETHRFLFAYEEALGYAFGATVMDKDGLSALLAFTQMTSELASKGLSVFDELDRLYRRFGLTMTRQVSIALKPGKGPVTELLRKSPPTSFAEYSIETIEDLKTGAHLHAIASSGLKNMPSADTIIYRLSKGARVIVRPSGTEPKLKCYYELVGTFSKKESYEAAKERTEHQLKNLIQAHQTSLAPFLS